MEGKVGSATMNGTKFPPENPVDALLPLLRDVPHFPDATGLMDQPRYVPPNPCCCCWFAPGLLL